MTDAALTRAGKPRKNAPGAGRPDKLTPEVQEKILTAVSNFQRIEVAAELAGCSREVFYGALRTAHRAEEQLRNGVKESDLSGYERKCVEFSADLLRAMARAEGVAVDSIRRAGSEPSVERKTTTRHAGMDDAGKPLFVTETTTTEKPPDWRARAWYLEHAPTLGGAYVSKQRVQLTGAEGGPIQMDVVARMEAIGQKIKAHAAREAQECIQAESREMTE